MFVVKPLIKCAPYKNNYPSGIQSTGKLSRGVRKQLPPYPILNV